MGGRVPVGGRAVHHRADDRAAAQAGQHRGQGTFSITQPLWDAESQESLQFFLLKVSLILVPIMLIPKPVILWLKMTLLVKDKHNTIQTYNVAIA